MKRYTEGDIVKMIRQVAEECGLEINFVMAIASVESNFDYQARRFEPKWEYWYQLSAFSEQNGITALTEQTDQATSWGVMQVMGTVCRELGHKSKLTDVLEDPILGIRYGCKKLIQIQKRYEDEDAVISAYNAGSARRNKNPLSVGLQWSNQEYVNKVKASLTRLRKIEGN